MGRSLLLVDFGFGGGGITAAGLVFSVEEGVDYFPIVKWADGAVKRNRHLEEIDPVAGVQSGR